MKKVIALQLKMRDKIKNITILLLILFLSVVAERMIPHSHIEKDSIIVADFSDNEDKSHEEEAENIHSSNFQLSNFNFSFSQTFIITQFLNNSSDNEIIEEQHIEDYNILPKILNTLLFIIHTYSSKAPPFFN